MMNEMINLARNKSSTLIVVFSPDYFPYHNETVTIEYLKRLSNKKNILVVFPEGTRGNTEQEQHELKRGLPGMILMAQKSALALGESVRISPWAIYGTEGISPDLKIKLFPGRKPLSFWSASG